MVLAPASRAGDCSLLLLPTAYAVGYLIAPPSGAKRKKLPGSRWIGQVPTLALHSNLHRQPEAGNEERSFASRRGSGSVRHRQGDES